VSLRHYNTNVSLVIVTRNVICLLTVTTNEKLSSLPLNAASSLAAVMAASRNLKTGQQSLALAQAMAQKVICYLQHLSKLKSNQLYKMS